MNETKSALLKLLMAYVFCVASVFVIAVLATLLTGGLSGRRGLPLGAAIALAILAAFVLLGIFVCIAIGVAVFIDAKQRDMEPWLWALVAALVPYFLGLIAYLIARKPSGSQCPACGGAAPGHSAYCPHCGHVLQHLCPSCSRPTDPTSRFCAHCGASIGPAPDSGGSLATSPQDD
jgi:hypothetical protein